MVKLRGRVKAVRVVDEEDFSSLTPRRWVCNMERRANISAENCSSWNARAAFEVVIGVGLCFPTRKEGAREKPMSSYGLSTRSQVLSSSSLDVLDDVERKDNLDMWRKSVVPR